MNKKIIAIIIILILAGSAYYIADYLALTKKPITQKVILQTPNTSTDSNSSSDSTQVKEVKYKVEIYAENIFVPWSISFTSPDRMLVTERSGAIREIINGKVNPKPLVTFPEASTISEEGLMGLAVDPDYQTNKYLYVCLAYTKNDKATDRVQRLVDNGTDIKKDKILMDDIPAAMFHAGCRVKFGPDKMLYITTGDATNKQQAQDKNSLGGKILRINSDGTFPQDNPFPNSPVYSFGHRNPQGIDWHPPTQTLFETEHGPSGNDGPGGGDEVNLIKKGENYGWPIVSHEKSQAGLISPKIVYTPAVAPASGMFYKSDKIPQFTNNFFFGMLRGEGIMRVVVDDTNPEQIISYEKLPDINYGRIRDIAEGPDGAIYFSTSNRDGRGKVRAADDKIYKISSNN
jgi:glucose/arabinose dehydrogenase